ncbi:MAG TPA: ABC transporter permease subunit [Elusimicrobiota bacterium]|nr:ABC transporter permease subunit [Elusimicrobiota bacterium]
MDLRIALAIARKELREVFNSPTPYVFFVVVTLLSGWFYVTSLFVTGQAALDDLFSPLPLLFVFFLPAITMRLFAEEIKMGTFEVLATLPVRETDIIVGKYLAALALLASALALTAVHPALLLVLGRPQAGPVLTGYLGSFLLGAAFGAAGLFSSTLTRNQVVSFIVGFLICFGLFLIGKTSQYVPGLTGSLLAFSGVDAHYEMFLKGVVDTRDIVYFLSVIGMFLAAAYAVVSGRRWR